MATSGRTRPDTGTGTGTASLSVLPFAVMAVVAGVDIAGGSGIGFLPLISLGPAFAGLIGGWRRTAAIGLLALVLCYSLAWHDGAFHARRGYTAMSSVAGVTIAGIAATVIRRRREAELAERALHHRGLGVHGTEDRSPSGSPSAPATSCSSIPTG